MKKYIISLLATMLFVNIYPMKKKLMEKYNAAKTTKLTLSPKPNMLGSNLKPIRKKRSRYKRKSSINKMEKFFQEKGFVTLLSKGKFKWKCNKCDKNMKQKRTNIKNHLLIVHGIVVERLENKRVGSKLKFYVKEDYENNNRKIKIWKDELIEKGFLQSCNDEKKIYCTLCEKNVLVKTSRRHLELNHNVNIYKSLEEQNLMRLKNIANKSILAKKKKKNLDRVKISNITTKTNSVAKILRSIEETLEDTSFNANSLAPIIIGKKRKITPPENQIVSNGEFYQKNGNYEPYNKRKKTEF
ncbi:hypothetical protein ACFLYU_00960 [Candidatus Dependentiae bacterium]